MYGVIRRTTTPQPPDVDGLAVCLLHRRHQHPRRLHDTDTSDASALLSRRPSKRLVTPSWVLTISHALASLRTYEKHPRSCPCSCFRISYFRLSSYRFRGRMNHDRISDYKRLGRRVQSLIRVRSKFIFHF